VLTYLLTYLLTGSCSGERGKVFTVETYCYVAVCRRGGRLGGARRFGAHRGRRGAGTYRGGRPPTSCIIEMNRTTWRMLIIIVIIMLFVQRKDIQFANAEWKTRAEQ